MGHIEYMEQGVCARCGSGNVHPVDLIGGRAGENLLAFFVCGDCKAKYIEVYEYTIKGLFPEDEEEA